MLFCLYKFSCFFYLSNALPLLYILISKSALKIAIIIFIGLAAIVFIFISFFLIRHLIRSKKRKKFRNYFSNIISEIAVYEAAPETQSDNKTEYSIAEPVSLNIEKKAGKQKISLVIQGNKNEKAIVFEPFYTANSFTSQQTKNGNAALIDGNAETPLKTFCEWLKSIKIDQSHNMMESDEQPDKDEKPDKTVQYIDEIPNANAEVITEPMAEVSPKQSFSQNIPLEPGLYKMMQSSFIKKVFIGELTKASRDMAGTARENIKWVYEHLQLVKDSEKRLQSNRWHIKAKAIQELAQMQQKRYVKKLYKLANHSNTFVRQEAQTAIVKMFGFSGLRFLNVVNYTISDWQQLCLLQELTLKQISSFAGVERWVRSSNTSVVTFALRLIETYHCYELHDEVAEQLNHPSEGVQKMAVQTLGEIYQPRTAALLIDAYNKVNRHLQFAVLKVFQKAATENEIPFLLEQLKHPDNQFKIMAARAIHNCSADNTAIIRDNIINNGYSAAALLSKLLEEEII